MGAFSSCHRPAEDDPTGGAHPQDAEPLQPAPSSSIDMVAGQMSEAAAADQVPSIRQAFISYAGDDSGHIDFGEDNCRDYVTRTFADHLADRIRKNGVGVFIDHRRLDAGAAWQKELESNARSSQVMVVVLSPGYLKQAWCLKELRWALDSGAHVMPVCYGFKEPGDVSLTRLQELWPGKISDPHTGQVWGGLVKRLGEHQQATIVDTSKGAELALEVKVLKAVLEKMPPQPLQAGFAVALEQSIKAVSALLISAPLVAIVGAGGMGKTTLAQRVFDELRSKFLEAAANVEVGQDGKIEVALETLLRGLGVSSHDIAASEADKAAQLRSVLEQKGRALLLLDNLWTSKQLTDLLPYVPPGTTVVVTTRDREVVERRAQVFNMPELSPAAALQLLRHHHEATNLPVELQGLEIAITKACGGMPLALEVAGAYLQNSQDVQHWQDLLDHLETGYANLSSDLLNVVDLSVAKLADHERDMFLDAATVMHGRSKWHALCAWEAMYSRPARVRTGLNRLMQRSLVKTDENDMLLVHDVIRAFAGDKAGQDGRRIWNRDQAAESDVEAIVAHNLEQLGPMPRLRVMLLERLGGDWVSILARIRPDGALPAQLLWLRLPMTCDSLDWMDTVALSQLRVWDCTGSVINSVPEAFGETLKRLKTLRMQMCGRLIELPNSFGDLTALTSLDLSECESLQRLPESFGNLTALTSLNLALCASLVSLPESFGKLTALTSLDLSGSTSAPMALSSLPESFGDLTALKMLRMSCCCELTRLPDSFGNLTALTSLYLGRCELVNTLPDSFDKLTALTSLNLHSCIELSSLPTSFGNLTALTSLSMHSCERLPKLPESFCNLTALTSLDLCWCLAFSSLPPSFGNLTALITLRMSSCGKLFSLPESFGNLTALTSLRMRECVLTDLPDSFGKLTALTSLGLRYCARLTELPASFGNLTALTSLDLSYCSALSRLPDSFSNLTALTSLDLSYCKSLGSLPESFGNLPALPRLNLEGCSALSSLPESFGNLTALTSVDLSDCRVLSSLPDSFGHLTALSTLSVSACRDLTKLPDSFGDLTALTSLDLSSCEALRSLPESFSNLTALTFLDLSYCRVLSSLPPLFVNLTALTSLSLSYFSGLSSLPPSFGDLTALKTLSLDGCDELVSKPETFEFSNLAVLTSLDLSGSPYKPTSLRSLPASFGNLTALTKLNLSWLLALRSLPESFGNLTALTSLDLSCLVLRSLPPLFGNLTALTSLDLSWCKILGNLPESIGNLTALTSLNLQHCTALSSLPESFGTLTALTSLHLSGEGMHPMSLSSLPESFGNLTALTNLNLWGCERLTELPDSFGNLTALIDLDMRSCPATVPQVLLNTKLVNVRK